MRLSFYNVNSSYCNYLRKFDYRVPSVSADKANRPFIGIVLEIGSYKYFAPLSSPKPKHMKMDDKKMMDIIKIAGGEYSIINFNNMLPICSNAYEKIELTICESDTPESIRFKNLLNIQLSWCNANKNLILNKAIRLYNNIVKGRANQSLLNRCCNFTLLEQKCLEYDDYLEI